MSMGEWRKAPDGKTRWWDGQAWGAELTQATPAVPKPAPARKPVGKWATLGCGGLIVLVIIAIAVSCSISVSKSHEDATKKINIVSARNVCEKAVKQQLKAPDTAKFTWDKQDVTSDTAASLSGHVSSENSFGALIATNVTCEATYDPAAQETQAHATLAK